MFYTLCCCCLLAAFSIQQDAVKRCPTVVGPPGLTGPTGPTGITGPTGTTDTDLSHYSAVLIGGAAVPSGNSIPYGPAESDFGSVISHTDGTDAFTINAGQGGEYYIFVMLNVDDATSDMNFHLTVDNTPVTPSTSTVTERGGVFINAILSLTEGEVVRVQYVNPVSPGTSLEFSGGAGLLSSSITFIKTAT